MILHDDPIAPSRLRPELSKDADAILLRMLAKAPGERYATWADLALELANIGRLSVFQQTIPDREKFFALRHIAALDDLGDGEIWEMVHAGRWSRAPARTTIVREGESGSSLFFLGSGEAKVIMQERLLNVLRTGEYFGEMAYIKAGTIPRHATVESITDVLLAEFDAATLKQVSKNCHLHLTFALLHTMVDRLMLADERIIRTVT